MKYIRLKQFCLVCKGTLQKLMKKLFLKYKLETKHKNGLNITVFFFNFP